MSRHRIVISKFLLLSLLLTLATRGEAQTPGRSACKVGKNAPKAGFWAWAYGSRVKVYLLRNNFIEEQSKSIVTALHRWNEVSVLTNSAVVFEYAGITSEPQACDNCVTIMRGSVSDKRKQHTAADLIAYSEGDRVIVRATIVIASGLTNLAELSEVVTHELGHTFGLFDCYTCGDKTTVMNQFKGLNSPNGLMDPTSCDIAQVMSLYRNAPAETLASKRRKRIQIDEGAEPEEDDTPIVVPHP